jgi:hypothetical protein
VRINQIASRSIPALRVVRIAIVQASGLMVLGVVGELTETVTSCARAGTPTSASTHRRSNAG